jgi:hypothetical protein
MYFYWNNTQQQQLSTLSSNITDYSFVLQSPKVLEAMIVDLWIAEQPHEEDAYPTTETLRDCLNCGKPYRYPGLQRYADECNVGLDMNRITSQRRRMRVRISRQPGL